MTTKTTPDADKILAMDRFRNRQAGKRTRVVRTRNVTASMAGGFLVSPKKGVRGRFKWIEFIQGTGRVLSYEI